MTRELVRAGGAVLRRLVRRGGGGRHQVRRAARRRQEEHPGAPARLRRRSTCRRSSTTSGCARTASSTRRIRWARCATCSRTKHAARASSPPSAATRCATVIGLLKEHGISQMPVLEQRAPVGPGDARSICSNYLLDAAGVDWTSPIDDLVEADYATVTPQTKIQLLQEHLQRRQAGVRARARRSRRRHHQDRSHRVPGAKRA